MQHFVVVPVDFEEDRWILLAVTPGDAPVESPAIVVLTEGHRKDCEVAQAMAEQGDGPYPPVMASKPPSEQVH